MHETDRGIADGTEAAREPNLEVQLGFAGTLVATATALCWYFLEALHGQGAASVGALITSIAGIGLLQLYVVDHSWFLVQRAAWLGAVLRGRQDRRNHEDAEFMAELEWLYDAGSVRFYRGFANLTWGLAGLLTLVGLAQLQRPLLTGAPLVGVLLVAPTALFAADRLLSGRVALWTRRVSPVVRGLPARLGVPWVAVPHGVHRSGCGGMALRAFLGLMLVAVDLAWVLAAEIAPAEEVVQVGDPAVIRVHLGGLSPRAVPAELTLHSDTIDADVLDAARIWLDHGALLVLPTDGLALGPHRIELREVRLGAKQSQITLTSTQGTTFVLVE
ncbi:MAG: hypothetical protein ACI8PZ_005337 [Myxococcota bacterium]|jgi:hypothetical protein